jgi:adenylate kinase family enzyme
MSKAHNKKRNTALLYEFLVRTISSALVEGDKKRSSTALRILRKHYKPGTHLYKEFRLFNALVKTTISSDAIVTSILSEARAAANGTDVDELSREKSLLIRNINHMLKDDHFYDQPIAEYRLYATIQTLLNEWRKPAGTADITSLANYENQLREWLLVEKKKEDHVLIDETPGTTRLVMKMMMKKMNEKYSVTLNNEQREIIKAYAFSSTDESQSNIKKRLKETRIDLLESIDQYIEQKKEDTLLVNKLRDVRTRVIAESLENVDDFIVSRFMLYSTLCHELTTDEGED